METLNDFPFLDLRGLFTNLFTELLLVVTALVIAIIGYITRRLKKEKSSVLNVTVNSGNDIKGYDQGEPKQKTGVILSNFTPVNENEIIGRKNDLVRLNKVLLEGSSLIVLKGVSGIGKSIFATLYVLKYSYSYNYIVWIDGHKGVAEGFIKDVTLLKKLNITINTRKYVKENFLNILHKLNDFNEGLLVIDSAPRHDVTIETCIKPILIGNGRWKLIVTSNRNMPISLGRNFDIPKLRKKHLRQLFYRHYEEASLIIKLKNIFKVNKIINILNHHTMAVDLFAQIADKRDSYYLKELIKDLRRHTVLFAKDEIVTSIHSSTGSKNKDKLSSILISTFSVSQYLEKKQDTESEKILKKNILIILKHLIIFPLNHTINIKKFRILCPSSEQDINLVFDELTDMGWLIRGRNSILYTLHPIVQISIILQIKLFAIDVEHFINELLKTSDSQNRKVAQNILSYYQDSILTVSPKLVEDLTTFTDNRK